MNILRTPDARFDAVPGYAFAPHYTEVANGALRLHHIEAGSGAPVLLLHGEPSWSFLYRKFVPRWRRRGIVRSRRT